MCATKRRNPLKDGQMVAVKIAARKVAKNPARKKTSRQEKRFPYSVEEETSKNVFHCIADFESYDSAAAFAKLHAKENKVRVKVMAK